MFFAGSMFSPFKNATTAVSKTFRSQFMREREVSAIKMSQGLLSPYPPTEEDSSAAAFEMSHQKRMEKTGKGKCDRRRRSKKRHLLSP